MIVVNRRTRVKWALVLYDVAVMLVSGFSVFFLMHGAGDIEIPQLMINFTLFLTCIFAARFVGKVYSQIWRYGGTEGYVRIIITETIGYFVYFLISRAISSIFNIPTLRTMALVCMDTLGVLILRMMYRYCFKFGSNKTAGRRFLLLLLRIFAGIKPSNDAASQTRKINVAILGAGTNGVALADELSSNKNSIYLPKIFIDVNKQKVGRVIFGMRVYNENDNIPEVLQDLNIQEVIFTVHDMPQERKRELYEFFSHAGCKILVYDAPQLESGDVKSRLREFSVEELLFRRQQFVVDVRTKAYYKDKVILITGGGGSIGSELCRQIATMSPRQLIILDIYENCAYDIQQELKRKYNGKLNLQVEICSITNKEAMDRVFRTYHPQIVINAAAHKHVPLMEHNCIEAVENNVFGCRNVIDCCEEFGAERFMMVSTDKAVNPTNVMGATKRMCEMLVQSASTTGKVKYSATRFGNVLGSAGSVIPLFKKQIAEGGPVTITDKRITRYFMTIPEASQLVLASGAMARNGELFVLDMGTPVKILDLATNMIKLMGAQDIEIVETGLRPGEKLYEELLVKTEELDKTDNSKIFIERDKPLTKETIETDMQILRDACNTADDNTVREALRKVVPTFIRPEDVNEAVGK